jgi:hypothetical protein
VTAEERERSERELEELLRRLPPERPAAERRAAARREFLAAGAEAGSRAPAPSRMGRGMPERGPNPLDRDGGDEERDGFVAWLAVHAATPPPRAEARQHARLAFLTAVAAEPLPRRARRSYRAAVLVAAAAAILAVTFLLPEPDRWHLRLDGPLRFADDEYGVGDEERLAAALEESGTLETLGAGARLSLAHDFDVELSPDATLLVPTLPELDGASPIDFELTRGEAYVRTAASYPGNPITLRTELVEVTLHGTTVGILVDELGTCVCVCDGTARVTSTRLSGGSRDVEAHHTLRVYRDPALGTKFEPFPSDPDAHHTNALIAFHASQ